MEVDKGKKISSTTEIGHLFAIIIGVIQKYPRIINPQDILFTFKTSFGQLDKFIAKKRSFCYAGSKVFLNCILYNAVGGGQKQ